MYIGNHGTGTINQKNLYRVSRFNSRPDRKPESPPGPGLIQALKSLSANRIKICFD